jgi:hypothetical protein
MGTSCQHQFPADARILLLQPLQQLAPRRIACDAKVGVSGEKTTVELTVTVTVTVTKKTSQNHSEMIS